MWGFMHGKGMSEAGLQLLVDEQVDGVNLLAYVNGGALPRISLFSEKDKALINNFVHENRRSLEDEVVHAALPAEVPARSVCTLL